MQRLNPYFKHSKISVPKFRKIVRYFALDLTASDCAALTGISLRSVNPIYLKIRERMKDCCAQQSSLKGELEADESYFGARRVRGKRGRGAYGKTIVFGPLKRGNCVYTEIVLNTSKHVLQAVIREHADISSVINTDGWRGYDGLVDIGLDKHFRVNHSNDEFVRGKNHVNAIESFWSFAKRRLAKFNGVPRHTIELLPKGL